MARQRNPVVIRPSQRRQQSKWKREQSRQRAIIAAGLIAILFILAIPAYGYWANFVAPPRSVVLQIDNTKYTLGFITKYMQGLQKRGMELNLSVDPFQFMQLLQENALVKSGAASKGITVDPSEVDQEIRKRILPGTAPADTPQDQLDREFNETYTRFLSTANLSEKEYRDMVEASLLRDKLKMALGAEVPSVAKQARISWIVIASNTSDEEADAAAAERVAKVSNGINQGADFAALAESYSDDRTSAVKGGEYGWVPEKVFGALDETIFGLQPGEVSDAVYLENYTYFVKVHEIEDAREVEPDMKDNMKEGVLQEWLAQERGNHRIISCFGGGSAGGSCDWQYDWLIKRVSESATNQQR